MTLFKTVYERKSLAITTAVMAVVVLLMFIAGMRYLDPMPESGVEVAYGVDMQGMGQPTVPPAATAQQQTTQKQESKPEESSSEEVKENLLAQDNDEEVAVPEVPKKEEKKKETPKTEKPKPAPKPSRETSDALSNILGAANAGGSGTAGQGDSNVPGYQGKIDGSQYANSYYGSGGGGNSGKGWGLKGRSIASQGKVQQDCNEEGRVVVEIEVDRSGKVVKATAGVKGTTNSAQCLLDAARKTAYKHSWNPDDNAPVRQIGFIVVNFKLGEEDR
jgi:outer membrane transport energization protein tonB